MATTMSPRVLAIDDDPAVCLSVAEALGKEFDVRTVGRGRAALEIVSCARPDVVLLDLLLPDIPGDLLASQIRASDATLPLVVLSVVDQPASVVRLMRVGSVDYLPKPFDAGALRAAVRQALRASPQAEPWPPCENLLGISPAIIRVRQRLAEASYNGRPLLLRAEGGFDLADVARACAWMQGPDAGFMSLWPNESAEPRRAVGPVARGVVYAPLSDDGTEAGIHLMAGLCRLDASSGGNLQTIFGASRLAPAHAEALLRATPDVEVVDLPPLRERPEDLHFCLLYFVEKHARRAGRPIRAIAVDTLGLLLSYRWPGNIQEMDAVAAQLVHRNRGPTIDEPATSILDRDAVADYAVRTARFGAPPVGLCRAAGLP